MVTPEDMVPPTLPAYARKTDFLQVGENFLRSSVRLCDLHPSDRVLDVGCGVGRFAVPLTRYLNGGTYDGMDVVLPSIEWCSAAIAPHHPNFRFHHVDAHNTHYNPDGTARAADYEFPFPDGSFDFIFSNSLFTHLLEDATRTYVAEMARVMAPNARALITAFLLDDEALELVRAGAASFALPYTVGMCRVEHEDRPEAVTAYPEEQMLDMFISNGLSVEVLHGSWCGRPGHNEFDTKEIVVARRI